VTGGQSSPRAAPARGDTGERDRRQKAARGAQGVDGRLSREQVRAVQRERILAAMAAITTERGVAGATVEGVVERAGVARGTFYEVFDDFGACLRALLEASMRRAVVAVERELEREGSWPDKALGALAALLGLLEDDPALARMGVVDALAAPAAVLTERARELELLKHMVDRASGHGGATNGGQSLLRAETAVNAVAGALHARIVRGEAPPFLSLLGPLSGVALVPYLDARALAKQVKVAERMGDSIALERSARPAAGAARLDTLSRGLANPSAYRARQCLRYVAAHPGASNGEVGEGVGVSHGGQISTLLARLAREGLLGKHAGGPGHPNAWHVTPEGERAAHILGREARQAPAAGRLH
jgi:AcrR family transcriptional regulator